MKKIIMRFHQLVVFIKYVYFYLYCNLFNIDNKNVWLISERGNEARDNGYAFYKFMEKNHPELEFKYVIEKKSTDLTKFIDKSRIIYHGSAKHYILFLTSGYLLSTHIMGYSPEFRMFNKLDKWGLVKIPGKRIYLNHGIEVSNTNGLKYGNIKVDLFVCGGKVQYDNEVNSLGHPSGVVRLTGMPRYDYLVNNLKRQILIMPTWRMNLFYCSNSEKFKETNYYFNWNKLLKNKDLTFLLEKYNLKLIFYPHYEIQPYINAFNCYSDRITIASLNNFDVQELLNQSELLITDYSSVMFDFAYLNKPIIYYQFDYSDFMKFHYGKGYFEYNTDGFGPITYNLTDTINMLKYYIETNFSVEKKYLKKMRNGKNEA